MSLYYFWLASFDGSNSVDPWAGGILAAITCCIAGACSSLVLETDEVMIAGGRVTWKGRGQNTLDLPLSAFGEMFVLEDGLHCLVGHEVRDLLEGTESRENRCCLYRVIKSTLKANGHTLPETLPVRE